MVDSAPQLRVSFDEASLEYRWPDGTYYLPESELLATPEKHPECPERVANIRHIVDRCLDDYVDWEQVEPASRATLEAVHDADYLAELAAFRDEPGRISADTWLDEATLTAAYAAAGAAIQAGRQATETDESVVTYALARPSGHHAQTDRADGLCFLNNVALAAEHAVRRASVDRVAILDWDVHHANGTQEIFYDRDDVLVVSIHNDHGSWDPDTHPQTGAVTEDGAGDGVGYTVNLPLPGGTDDDGYAAAFERIIEPIVESYDPDLLLVSAGQDPGFLDPQGRNLVTKSGFEEMGARARRLARTHADGALAIVQEGGYQQSHLAFATLGVLEGALGVDVDVDDPFTGWSADQSPVYETLEEHRDHLAAHWPVLEH